MHLLYWHLNFVARPGGEATLLVFGIHLGRDGFEVLGFWCWPVVNHRRLIQLPVRDNEVVLACEAVPEQREVLQSPAVELETSP